jgi:hypothetical protein
MHGAGSKCSVVACLSLQYICGSLWSLGLEEKVGRYRNACVLCGDDQRIHVSLRVPDPSVEVPNAGSVEQVWFGPHHVVIRGCYRRKLGEKNILLAGNVGISIDNGNDSSYNVVLKDYFFISLLEVFEITFLEPRW